jgi:hypothetical protein
MTANIKVGGTWRTLAGQFVKVGGSWHSVSQGWVKVAGVWRQWFVGAFSDNFTRTTTGSLGTSSSGGTWTAIKGIWFANGTLAQSNDAPTNNSIATMTLGSPNVTLIAQSVTQGTGISFLVQDSTNWWAAAPVRVDTAYSYIVSGTYVSTTPVGYVYAGSTPYSFTATAYAGTYTTTNFTYMVSPDTYTWNHGSYGYYVQTAYGTTFSYFVYIGGGTYVPASTFTPAYVINFGTYSYYSLLSAATYNTTTSSTPNYYTYTVSGNTPYYSAYYGGTYSYTFSGATTAYYLRIYNSVAGTVSTIFNTLLTNIGNSLKVSIVGTSVTATAYSDNAQTTSVGSAAYTLASTPTATNHGIILTSSNVAQGYTLGYFSASLN